MACNIFAGGSSLATYPRAPARIARSACKNLLMHRKYQGQHLGITVIQIFDKLQTVGILQGQIQNHQVRFGFCHQLQSLAAVVRFAAYAQIRLLLNDALQRLPHQRMIVNQENADLSFLAGLDWSLSCSFKGKHFVNHTVTVFHF